MPNYKGRHIGGMNSILKEVIKLKVTFPDGSTEIMVVTEYAEYNPQDVVPSAVKLTPHLALFNTVAKTTFLAMLKTISIGEGEWNAAQYAIGILGINNEKAEELVESL